MTQPHTIAVVMTLEEALLAKEVLQANDANDRENGLTREEHFETLEAKLVDVIRVLSGPGDSW